MEAPSISEIALKGLPFIAAVATAVVSLLREVASRRHPDESGSKPGSEEAKSGNRNRKDLGPFGVSGWALVGLAVLTCIAGVWSTVVDAYSDKATEDKIAELHTQLTNANGTIGELKTQGITLSGQLSDSTDRLQKANGKLAKEADKSRDAILGEEETNAKVLKVQEDLTFVSLLSTAHEPAEGIVELDLTEPVRAGIGVHGRGRLYFAEQFYRGWEILQAFDPVAPLMNFSENKSVEFDVGLGSFRNWQGQTINWSGNAEMERKQNPPGPTDPDVPRLSLGIRDRNHLILRLKPLEDPDLVDLWNGPRKDNISARVLVKFGENVPSAELEKIRPVAEKLITNARIYYTVSRKIGICKKAELLPQRADLYPNGLEFRFGGTENVETVRCPEFLLDPDKYVVEKIEF